MAQYAVLDLNIFKRSSLPVFLLKFMIGRVFFFFITGLCFYMLLFFNKLFFFDKFFYFLIYLFLFGYLKFQENLKFFTLSALENFFFLLQKEYHLICSLK